MILILTMIFEINNQKEEKDEEKKIFKISLIKPEMRKNQESKKRKKIYINNINFIK